MGRDMVTASQSDRAPTLGAVQPLLRFAPSPNGFLHLGHAYSALMNERLAHSIGGRLLIRLEDIDIARCTTAFAQAIVADLAWLGITWSPPISTQADRFAIYGRTLDRLRDCGLLYPCTCTRAEMRRAVSDPSSWPRDPDGSLLYPGTCRDRSLSENEASAGAENGFALRLNMDKALRMLTGPLTWTEYGEGDRPLTIQADPSAWGDVLLARKDIPTSYHVAVVTDDAVQGITHVVRGEDLYQTTSLHRLLQVILDLPAPAYHHHRLLRDDAGRKLSKSTRSPTLRAARRDGVTARDIRAALGFP